MPKGTPHPDHWILPLFFGANAIVSGLLIGVLGVRAPVNSLIPWIFGGAFLLTVIPPIRRRVTTGPLLWRLAPPVLYAAVISLASSVNPSATTGVEGNVFHPVEFAGLAFLAQLAAHGGLAPRSRWRLILIAAVACVLFGVIDEIHQAFVPHRASTVLDVGLDTLGTIAGTHLYLAARRLTSALPFRKT